MKKWKIEKLVRKGKYDYAVVLNHPNASKYGYVLHHRIVMENHLGRLLDVSELVHHKDEITRGAGNRPSNLEVLTRSGHAKLHAIQRGRKWVELKCPNCQSYFEKLLNASHIQKGGIASFCSRRCGTKFRWNLKQLGTTLELVNALEENVVRIYRKYNISKGEKSEWE